MNLRYKIIEVNTNEHSIVVRFYTDIITEEMLAIDVVDGVILRGRTDYSIDLPFPAPTGLELNKFISTRAPTAWLETQESLRGPNGTTALTTIAALVGREVEAIAPAEAAPVYSASNFGVLVNTSTNATVL